MNTTMIVIFNNYKIDVKMPENRKIFMIGKDVYVCAYDKFYYIHNICKNKLYIYNLDIADDVMEYNFNHVKYGQNIESVFYIKNRRHNNFDLSSLHDFKSSSPHDTRKIVVNYRHRDDENVNYYITDRFFTDEEKYKVDTNTKPLDMYIENDNIILITDEYKFVFEVSTNKLMKENISPDDVEIKKDAHKVDGDDKLMVVDNNIIFTDILHVNISDIIHGIEILLKSPASKINEHVNVGLLLERSKLFSDMADIFDNEKDLYLTLQTEISNINFQYIAYYYDYINGGSINRDKIIELFKICDYLLDVDRNYLALCIVNIYIYGNIYGSGGVIKDLLFCVKCLKLLNSRQYPEFLLLLHKVYQNYDVVDIEKVVDGNTMMEQISEYFDIKENYYTIEPKPGDYYHKRK